MPGISTGPSFMSRLGSAMPGMINGLAQGYGDAGMKGTVKGSASLLNKPRPKPMSGKPMMPGGVQSPPVANGMPPLMSSSSSLFPSGEMPMINTGMSNMPFNMSQLPMNTMGNTGFAGGFMNRPSGFERPGMDGMGGIFGRYNAMSQQGQTPFGFRF